MVYDCSLSVDEVLVGQIYLGNLSAAQSATVRDRFGITHILSVCPDYPSTGANHLVIPVEDSEYADILIHLPNACAFVEDALAHGGRVLIHCVMGISRSTTILAAYLMKTRLLSPSAAISLIKKYRPCVQPNYGFVKQLNIFVECGYAPSPTHPCYKSWKRKHKQDVTNFLNQLLDTAVIIPKTLFISSEFPNDLEQAELLLYEHDITHFLSLGSPQLATCPCGDSIIQHHINVPPDSSDELVSALPKACAFIRDALAAGGRVLVYSTCDVFACAAVCAYLMGERNIPPEEATKIVQNALPLFHPTPNFNRALAHFRGCDFNHNRPRPPKTHANDTDLIIHTAASIMSESGKSGIDWLAFSDALAVVKQKASLAHPPSVSVG